MAPRGRGGKFSKPTRGGGKHFSRDLQPLDSEGNPMGMWRDPADNENEDSSEEEDSEEDSSEEEEESDDEGGPSQTAAQQQEMTREQRRAAAKLKKEKAIAKKQGKAAAPGDLPPSDSEDDDDDDMPANPNHTAKARSQAASAPSVAEASPAASSKKAGQDLSNLSRREREAIQQQQARERYQKLHAEGKTDEARADLERLRIVKERRAAEAARKAAEKEEKEAREKATAAERDAREAKLKAAAMGNAGDVKKGKAKGKK